MSLFAYGNTAKCQMEINEDSYIVKKIGDYIVLIAADGNGGSQNMVNVGAVASDIMVDYLTRFIRAETSILEIYNSIEAAMFTVSRCFLSINAVDEKYSNVYASMTVAIIEEISMNMVVASIGNTELRLVRNGQITRVNKLYSEAYELFEKNEISEQELYIHPKRAILTSALGVFGEAKIDVMKIQLMKEDILVLTTDGIYRCMTPEQVIEKLAEGGNSIEKAVDGVLKIADAACKDNCTMICAYVYDDNGIAAEKGYNSQHTNSKEYMKIDNETEQSSNNNQNINYESNQQIISKKRKKYLYDF